MSDTFQFTASDGQAVRCYRWQPAEGTPIRGCIQLAHGMGEHAGRYEWVGNKLADAGFVVTADDHRGHGKTAVTLGDFGFDGWNRALLDTRELIAALKNEFPDKPAFLLGHSMGAMLAQQYITQWGDTVDAVLLSGSPGFAGKFQSWLVRSIVRFERWRLGPDAESTLLQGLIFGSANKAFEDEVAEPTGFEWLSRDPETVRQYALDPLCGFVPCTGSLFDIFSGSHQAQQKDAVTNIPATLPIFVFAGTDDPVNNEMKNIDRMLASYRDHGLTVETRFYAEGRHEVFNETNREEVIADVLSFLDQRLKDAVPTGN